MQAREQRIEELTQELDQRRKEVAALSAANAELGAERVRLETSLAKERESTAEKLSLIEAAQKQLSDAFKALSAEALKSNNQSFLDLARETLEKQRQSVVLTWRYVAVPLTS